MSLFPRSMKRAMTAQVAAAILTSSMFLMPLAQAQMSTTFPSQPSLPTLSQVGCNKLNELASKGISLPSGAQETISALCGGGSGGSSPASSSSSSSVSSGSSSSTSSSGSSESSSSSSSGGSDSSSSTSSSSVPSSSSSSSVSSGPSDLNLIRNPSLEEDGGNGLPVGWHTGGFGNNNAVFTYPAPGFEGAKAADISISQYADGDAKWYFDDVPVTPGEQYLFSDVYTASAPSSLNVRYTMNDGSFVYVEIGNAVASDSWQQFSKAITPPTGAVSLTVFHLLKSAGSLRVDSFVLKQSASTFFDQGYVSLNFDDGWTSAYRNVLPMLNTAGIKGTFYVITDEAKKADASEVNLPDSYLDYSKLKEIQTAGHEVSAHTRTHTSLVGLSQAQATSEIQGSRNDLLAESFTPVDTFAYPYGDYNDNVIQLVKDNGFIGARGVEGGYNTRTDNKYALKVQNALMGTSALQMKGWIDHAIQTKTWLNIVIHQVDHLNNPSGEENYSTTPETLQEVVNYLKEKNVSVITNHQGLQMLQ